MHLLHRHQLVVRWVWLLSMGLIAASVSLPPMGWIVLGLAAGLAVWVSFTQINRDDRAPSAPWLLGVDLALGVGLIACSGGWRSPFWSVWLMLGVMAGWLTGTGAGVRIASVGLLLTAFSLTLIGSPTPMELLVFSAIVLGVLSGTWLVVLRLAPRTADGPPADQPSAPSKGEATTEWMLEAAALLGSAADSSQIMERALELAVGSGTGAAGPCHAALLLAGASGWEVRSARRLTPGDRQTVLAEPIGILAQAIADRTAVVSRQPAEDPALASMSALRVCREVVCAPLTRGGKPGGALLVGWNEPGAASSHVLAELQAIGRLTSAGLDGLDRLQRAETEKQRQGEVQEESRKRLARDLHDGPTQAVASLAMRLNYIGKLVERDSAAARRELTTAEEMARRATRDIRHMLFALRPLILESQGLVPALWQLGKKVHEVQGEQVIVEAERQDAENMSPLQQSVIFYIAEEAINNAVKHAQAQHIWVRFRPGASDWKLEIEDDGVGFNVGSVDEDYAQRGSLGLVNMRERAALAGGQLQVFSQEGSGTRILASIPRQAEASADV